MIMQKFHKGRLFEHQYWDRPIPAPNAFGGDAETSAVLFIINIEQDTDPPN